MMSPKWPPPPPQRFIIQLWHLLLQKHLYDLVAQAALPIYVMAADGMEFFGGKSLNQFFFLLSLKWMQKRQLYQRGVSILKICHRWLFWYVKPRESCECDNCVSFANRLNMLLVVWVTEMGSTRSSWHTFTVVAFIFHLRKYCSLFSLTIH